MNFINVENLSLEYSHGRRFALGQRDASSPTGSQRIVSVGANKKIIRALNGVSFSLESGDRLALVGNNGAGKTSLLKTLYGIYEPSGGSIRINGRVDALFNISLGFRPRATGRRNIVLRGLINGWEKSEIMAKVDDIIAFSELEEFIDMPLDSYSAGMAARLAFSIATALEPEILLMDEWIGAGDKVFQAKARNRMWNMAKSAGILILASHNNDLLKLTCNKVLELSLGEVSYFGPAKPYFA